VGEVGLGRSPRHSGGQSCGSDVGRQEEELLGYVPQDDPLQSLEIVEAVVGGDANGSQQGLARVFLRQPKKPPQITHGATAVCSSSWT